MLCLPKQSPATCIARCSELQRLTGDLSTCTCWHVEEESRVLCLLCLLSVLPRLLPALSLREHLPRACLRGNQLWHNLSRSSLSLENRLFLPAPWRKYRDILPVSWMAAQKAIEAFGYTKRDSIEARCDWYAKDELPKGYWDQHLTRAQSPTETRLCLWPTCLETFLGPGASHR